MKRVASAACVKGRIADAGALRQIRPRPVAADATVDARIAVLATKTRLIVGRLLNTGNLAPVDMSQGDAHD